MQFPRALVAVILLVWMSSLVQAQIPRTLAYQGVLTDSLGIPKPDDTYSLTFRLYESASGGSALWSETNSLQVKRGLFSTVLGAATPFGSTVLFDRPYWLSVQVGAEAELSPRIPLSAVAYSIRSVRADTAAYAVNAPQQGFVDSARIAGTVTDNAITSAKILNNTIQSADVAAGFTAPFADTASYARSAPAVAHVDSARIAGTVPDHTITSAKILDNTIQSADVAAGFTAPFADTAAYARSAPPIDYVDSARIAKSIAENAITSNQILDGTIQRADVDAGFTAPFADTAHYALSARPAGAAGGDFTGSYPNPAIANGVVTVNKIAPGQVVKDLNGLKDAITLVGGNGTTVSTNLDSIIISSGIFLNLPYTASDSESSPALTIINKLDGDGLNAQSYAGSGISASGYYGVVGESPLQGGVGVQGTANRAGGYGIWGISATDSGYAGNFDGNVLANNSMVVAENLTVTGTISKGGGSFKIDHPLDPANKYLYHSFVESPDMKNVYDGVAVLDGSGQTTVALPDWFDALNRDFRYQLTPIGAPAPDLHIAQEVSGNQFKIAGGMSGMKVSWQVTGIRKDAYAEKHRIPVEELKSPQDRGRYLHPDAFGYPKETGISYHAKPNLHRGKKK